MKKTAVNEQHSKEQPVLIIVQRYVELIISYSFRQNSANYLLYFLLQNCFDVKLRIRKRYGITEVIFKWALHPRKFQSTFIHFT